MLPNAPIHGFLIGWCIAALFGGGSAAWSLRRTGMSAAQIGIAFVTLAAAVFLGAKLLYVIEAWPALQAQRIAWRAALLWPRGSLVGGGALALAIGYPLARGLGRPYWRSADTVAPATGLLIFGFRIGCFLEGCCFGTPSSLPWAVRFPANWPPTEAYGSQLIQRLIPLGAPATVPVHPLQLYFAAVGLLLFVGLTAYRPYVRYDGELVLLFALSSLWSSWFLEHLRADPHDLVQNLVLVAAIVSTAVAAVIEWRLRAKANPLGIAASDSVDRGNELLECSEVLLPEGSDRRSAGLESR